MVYGERRGFGERKMYKITCADCGLEAEVPFKPDGSRPVYCRDCYQKHRSPRRYWKYFCLSSSDLLLLL